MLFAEISVAEGVEADEVPQSWIAIRSKDWILTETEVGLSFLEAVIKNQLDLRVLEDKHDQGDRRRLQFRDAVAVRCETKFDDWFNLDGRITKGFLKSIPQRFNSYDQADVSNLAKVKQIAHRIIQDEHDVRKNPKHLGYSCLEFVLNQTTDVSGAASTTVFNRRYVQTRRDEAVVSKNAWRHREESANAAKQQIEGSRGEGSDPSPGEAMTSSRSKGLPNGDCRRGAGHREHGTASS